MHTEALGGGDGDDPPRLFVFLTVVAPYAKGRTLGQKVGRALFVLDDKHNRRHGPLVSLARAAQGGEDVYVSPVLLLASILQVAHDSMIATTTIKKHVRLLDEGLKTPLVKRNSTR